MALLDNVSELTCILEAVERGNPTGAVELLPLVYDQLRRLLVDRARRRRSRKHGGSWERLELDAVELPVAADDALILEVHEALKQLTAEDPERAAVVKLRFFVGLENAEVAALLGVSEKTVERHWAFAKAWLLRAMRPGG